MTTPSTPTFPDQPTTQTALQGIRILDLTSVVFGPMASQTLADYGAEIIKIESPAGDSTRYTGPAHTRGLSAIFLGVNRNKKSLCFDLKQPSAREALLRLVDTADVLMHSMRPQKMAALGLDEKTLCARNPRLVYAGLYGFGAGGAYAGLPAYDDLIQGMTGVVDLVERQTGQARYFPTIAADKTCAMTASHAILAALFQRERTGRGQFIEIPMFESMTAYMLVEHLYGQQLKDTQEPTGYPRALTQWRKPYASKDGLICVMPYTDQHWQNFLKQAGYPEHAADPRFASIEARTESIAHVYETLGAIIGTQTTDHWLNFCSEIQVPAARVNRIDDLLNDPHLQDVGFFSDVQDTEGHTYRYIRNPVRMEQSYVAPTMAPRLGEHSCEVLKEAGFDQVTIDEMLKTGALKTL
ncbi:CaiB/BaiF CoA transferase family protein [Orrella sp. 11846]|uniref:CaiB/BaiF CoA transferase family protein n=1 Tax=Orrella sp. 11846 TaxID=3409913 RepID=UPI003B5B89A5